jgi:hypothetical protein
MRRRRARAGEYEQQTIRRRRDDEEIGGHELFHVIGEERAPGLRGRRDPAREVLRDRRL